MQHVGVPVIMENMQNVGDDLVEEDNIEEDNIEDVNIEDVNLENVEIVEEDMIQMERVEEEMTDYESEPVEEKRAKKLTPRRRKKSQRIIKNKLKKFVFDKDGTGSNADKAFMVD